MTETEPAWRISSPAMRLSPAVSRELHRKTLLLIAVFLAIHYLMLTARVVVVELDHQSEIARARAILVPFGALLCYISYLVLERFRTLRFVQQVVIGAALSSVAAVLHAFVWGKFLSDLDAASYPSTLSYTLYQSFYWYLFYFSWTTAYLALSYSITVREQELRSSALLAEAHQAQVRALRYQINPHFLFNTLNSIAALIGEDRDQAERMVLNLSDFFRTSLAVDPLEDVPLCDELALQELYLAIEKVRFPDRLSFVIDCPEELRSARVPSLILQPLVENAVRHGVARSERSTRIEIKARRVDDRIELTVSDNGGEGSSPTVKGTGVGLANVRNRLSARYGEEHRIRVQPGDPSGYTVDLTFPLRPPAP